MKIRKIISYSILCMTMVSCDAFLDPRKDGKLNEEGIWDNTRRAFGFLNTAYSNLPNGYNRISNAMLASATDEAVHSDLTSTIKGFNDGTWSPYFLIENVWEKNYTGIRRVNMYLERIDGVPMPVKPTTQGSSVELIRTRERMKGEAYFLRACFYFELVKRYGGVPLLTETLTEEEARQVKRASTDEVMARIVEDCDSAYNRLPLAYPEGRAAVPGYDEPRERGRASKGAVLALKAKTYLYWASPLFDPEGKNHDYYRRAAVYAGAVMATKKYKINAFEANESHSNIYVNMNTNNFGQYHKELIFSTSYAENSVTVERNNCPVSMGGKGYTSPTQNLADAYGMANGELFDWNNPVHAKYPYMNRDPRFYSTFVTNNQQYKMNGKETKIETFVGGADALGAYRTSTRTGYYLSKLLSSSAVWDGSTNNINRTWVILSYADIVLIYAEAKNEYENAPNDSVFKMVESIRNRAGLSPYKLNRTMQKDEMRQVIRNERQVELSFEEQRFFDVRRWRLMDDPVGRDKYLNIRGVEIKKDGEDNFSYRPYVIEQRVWNDRMYFYPIPQDELLRATQMTQNPGW